MGNQVPVTFQVDNATTNPGDEIYLSGSVAELGNWSPSPSVAPGQLVCHNYPTWFTVASVLAGATIQFKFVKVTSSGAVTWEGGKPHVHGAGLRRGHLRGLLAELTTDRTDERQADEPATTLLRQFEAERFLDRGFGER